MPLTSVLRKIVGLLLLAGVALSLGQTAQREQPPLIIKSTFGADLYHFYCSSCHGMDGKGRSARSGPATAPPDLTILSRQNGGAFPRDRVRASITHGKKATSAHGTNDMPVWGSIFRALDPSDILVEVRIENLVQYLASIQEPTGGELPD